MPLYKGKGDKRKCSNSRGISLLSVVDTLYGRVLIRRVRQELNVQYRRGNVGLGWVEDAWKCLP